MTPRADRQRTERLLERIRIRVAELRRVERSRADQNELHQRRHEITRLQWQLARLIRQQVGGGNLPA
jgi:hypothetical protein